MKKAMALLALTILTACDDIVSREIRTERNDDLYREAMNDYRAGRMDAALAGFEKAVNENPSNASARFQLACLQQDLRKDFVSAYCGYREFLLQQPESERAELARDRMSACEREAASALASKYGLNSAEGAEKELANVRSELKKMKDRLAMAEKNLGSSQERVRSLSAERDRLLAAVKGFDENQPDAPNLQDVLKEKRALELENDESDSGMTQALRMEKQLLENEEDEEISAGPALIPVRQPETPVKVESAKPPVHKSAAPTAPSRPLTYVVAEGDTLYGIAKRFYGSIRSWKAIRDANKATISSDNRLRVGDSIVLP